MTNKSFQQSNNQVTNDTLDASTVTTFIS